MKTMKIMIRQLVLFAILLFSSSSFAYYTVKNNSEVAIYVIASCSYLWLITTWKTAIDQGGQSASCVNTGKNNPTGCNPCTSGSFHVAPEIGSYNAKSFNVPNGYQNNGEFQIKTDKNEFVCHFCQSGTSNCTNPCLTDTSQKL